MGCTIILALQQQAVQTEKGIWCRHQVLCQQMSPLSVARRITSMRHDMKSDSNRLRSVSRCHCFSVFLMTFNSLLHIDALITKQREAVYNSPARTSYIEAPFIRWHCFELLWKRSSQSGRLRLPTTDTMAFHAVLEYNVLVIVSKREAIVNSIETILMYHYVVNCWNLVALIKIVTILGTTTSRTICITTK